MVRPSRRDLIQDATQVADAVERASAPARAIAGTAQKTVLGLGALAAVTVIVVVLIIVAVVA